jgi:rsbT co-antagonist protein RsbR
MTVTIEEARLERLLRVIIAVAGGDYDARVPLEERDDAFLEAELGVNFLAEELALRREQNQQQREELVARAQQMAEQQRELVRALSTPVIMVWPGVLALPLIGRIEDERAASVTSTLLARVAADRATHVILDLTGVDEIAAGTIPGLSRMVRAIGLLGARCLLTGLSPAIAARVVELGTELAHVRCFAQLSDGLAVVLAEKNPHPR